MIYHSKRPSSTMILFFLLALLLPPDAGSIRTHLSQLMKLKCDSLPFRSNYVNERCYFSVIQEVGGYSASLSERNASALCSTILPGAKVAIGVELSNILQCVSETGNKCDQETTLKSGRCYIRSPTKMNFTQAKRFCNDRAMDIPAPANDLENQMARDALDNGPAWVQKSFTKENGFKWSKQTGYSKWTTCDAGSHNSCNNDTASVIDRYGYWSNSGVQNLMDVVCVKPAVNEFTKVEVEKTPCNYHDNNANQAAEQLTALPAWKPGDRNVSRTCYISIPSSVRYNVMAKATVETQRGCEVLCDAKEECSGFSFRDAGFSSECILLSATTDQICESTIFPKKTVGCVARTNLTSEFGNDPCIDERVDSALVTNKDVLGRIGGYPFLCQCPEPLVESKIYILRVIDFNGRRITLEYRSGNSYLEQYEGMWMFRWNARKAPHIPIVAATCTRAEGTKCPCAPLKLLSHWDGRAIPKATPVVVKHNGVNPCKYKSGYFFIEEILTSSTPYNAEITDDAVFTCRAGRWFMFCRSTRWYNIVTAAACLHESYYG